MFSILIFISLFYVFISRNVFPYIPNNEHSNARNNGNHLEEEKTHLNSFKPNNIENVRVMQEEKEKKKNRMLNIVFNPPYLPSYLSVYAYSIGCLLFSWKCVFIVKLNTIECKQNTWWWKVWIYVSVCLLRVFLSSRKKFDGRQSVNRTHAKQGKCQKLLIFCSERKRKEHCLNISICIENSLDKILMVCMKHTHTHNVCAPINFHLTMNFHRRKKRRKKK